MCTACPATGASAKSGLERRLSIRFESENGYGIHGRRREDRFGNELCVRRVRRPARRRNLGWSGDYRFALNPKTVMEFTAGGVKTDSGMNYVYGVSGDRRVGEIWVGAAIIDSL